MFNWFTKRAAEAELEKRDLAVRRSEMLLGLKNEELLARQETDTVVQELAMRCAKEKGIYEHEYHSAMEDNKVELARLQAHIEHLRDVKEVFERRIKLLKDELDKQYIYLN